MYVRDGENDEKKVLVMTSKEAREFIHLMMDQILDGKEEVTLTLEYHDDIDD